LATFTVALGLPDGLRLQLRPGWDPSGHLDEQLSANIEKDLAVGYSLRGPHRDDLHLSLNNRSALSAMSRGQQKAFMLAFFLGMAEVMTQTSGRAPLLLFDDLGAELDSVHQATILNYLNDAPFQSLVTLVEIGTQVEPPPTAAMFHVKHGAIYRCYNGPVISNGPDPHPHVEFNERYL
jgi:DNA replication and repair protein RecF